MIRLIQHVSETAVRADGRIVGGIGPGLFVLVCAERGGTAAEADRLLERLLSYRVSSDVQGKMNLPVHNTDGNKQAGGLLVVSWFALTAGIKSGTRPSFTSTAASEDGCHLYERFMTHACVQHPIVITGESGVGMEVPPVNDGPVTSWLQIAPQAVTSVAKIAVPGAVKPV